MGCCSAPTPFEIAGVIKQLNTCRTCLLLWDGSELEFRTRKAGLVAYIPLMIAVGADMDQDISEKTRFVSRLSDAARLSAVVYCEQQAKLHHGQTYLLFNCHRISPAKASKLCFFYLRSRLPEEMLSNIALQ